MVDPIRPSAHQFTPYRISDDAFLRTNGKEDTHAAEEEVASLYVTSLQSLAQSLDSPSKEQALEIHAQAEVDRSLLGKVKDWLWKIFGWGHSPIAPTESQTEKIDNCESVSSETPVLTGGVPKLQAPEPMDQKRLSKAITDLNRNLVHRLKDMAEFEEEMRKSHSSKLDKLIFFQLVHSSIQQKKLKEISSLIVREDLMDIHKKNKGLQKQHFDLVDAINEENKARHILKWVNVGLTVIAVGGIAVGIVAGGVSGIVAVGTPLSFLGKGITTFSDGVLKYKNDAKTGELTLVKQEKKTNTNKKQDRISDMQTHDNAIAALLKIIRHHLDNQTKAERASFGRHS